MTSLLKCHPDTPCAAIAAISVEVAQPAADLLSLRYTVTGDIGALFVPPRKEPTRINDLWKTTCFEVFIRPVSGTAYHEFNFSPDTRWAGFDFVDYRTNSRDLVVPRAPDIEITQTATTLIADCLVHLPQPYTEACALGLTAVIEEIDGALSYWALTHPDPVKPDFHHPDSFVLRLPA
ncbi:MAG: DOMON-like domain-containing protein [Alphaproteobacteria bacterium]|nr:DOMON-like domain-containing protein [Alphaproteobacteria bacterium]